MLSWKGELDGDQRLPWSIIILKQLVEDLGKAAAKLTQRTTCWLR
jgi:hypothetical protein